VVDCAHGAAYQVAPSALWELGAEVIAIGVEPNGRNINMGVGSTHLEAIKAKVREVRADVGIALDGDADRLIVVDEKGQTVDGDQIMALIGSQMAKRGALTGGGWWPRSCRTWASNASCAARALTSCGQPWATAMSSKRCARAATTWAASNRAT
jgi:phosphomannomutase